MAPFVWIFAELNRGDTHRIHIIWKSLQNTASLADLVLPDNTEKRIKTVCKTIEKTQFLCVFFCRNIIKNVLLFCAVRVIYVLPNKERRVHIMKNEIRFTLESKQRPKLAQEIGNMLGTAPHYERVPSCAYDIAGYRHTYCSNMTKSGMNPKTLHYSTSWDIQIYRSQWMCTRISDLMMQRRNWKGWKSSGRYRRRLSRRKRKRCRRRCLR